MSIFNFKSIRAILLPEKYNIKIGYRHRKRIIPFDDRNNTDQYQKEVYSFTKSLMESEGLSSIIDIGCGSGYKFIKYFKDIENKIGVEIEPTLSYLNEKHPNIKWVEFNNLVGYTDILLLADVIEHVKYPDMFIDQILTKVKFKYIILSTPERDLVRGFDDFGPPKNRSHFREWNKAEFINFLSKFIKIQNVFISNEVQGTMVVVGKLNQK